MPAHTTRHTLARQWELLKRLPSRGPGKTASELARELQDVGFEVSKRQIERDLSELLEAFDLDCNNASIPYGWRWLPGTSAELPGLTVADALSLHLLRDQLRPMMPASLLNAMESRFLQAERKLDGLAANNAAAQWMHKARSVPPTLPFQAPHIDPEVLVCVQECLFADEQIDADYLSMDASEPHPQRLHPLGLVNRGPVTYLVATAWRYEDVRLYALHRLTRAARTHEASQRPAGFDLDAYIAAGALQFGQGHLRLEARIEPTLARVLGETPIAPDQVIEGGTLTATVPDGWQLRWWILSQGEAIEVTAPTTLRNEIRASLAAALARYAP